MKKAKKFFSKIHPNVPIIETNHQTAEMIKYANNSFLATKISFINQLANVCQNIPGANIDDIAQTIGLDPRIGKLFLNAGPGFGGSCLPKDLAALIKFSENMGKNNSLLKEVKEVNQKQPLKIIKLMEKINVIKKNNTISIFGLSFKKDTDDIRYSVSIEIVRELLKKKLKIKVHDPLAMENFKKIFKNKITYSASINDCLNESNCSIILTDWDDYKKITRDNLIKYMKIPAIIDTRGMLKKSDFNNIKFQSLGLGIEKS